jgi:hypothetical protein
MCDLIEANRSGSELGTPSPAIVRPVEPHPADGRDVRNLIALSRGSG